MDIHYAKTSNHSALHSLLKIYIRNLHALPPKSKIFRILHIYPPTHTCLSALWISHSTLNFPFEQLCTTSAYATGPLSKCRYWSTNSLISPLDTMKFIHSFFIFFINSRSPGIYKIFFTIHSPLTCCNSLPLLACLEWPKESISLSNQSAQASSWMLFFFWNINFDVLWLIILAHRHAFFHFDEMEFGTGGLNLFPLTSTFILHLVSSHNGIVYYFFSRNVIVSSNSTIINPKFSNNPMESQQDFIRILLLQIYTSTVQNLSVETLVKFHTPNWQQLVYSLTTPLGDLSTNGGRFENLVS